MSVATLFAKDLESSLLELSTNEWAVSQARERAIESITPTTAFESIVEVLRLAGRQDDAYAFSSCCMLAGSLAELSLTTEQPTGLAAVLNEITPISIGFGCLKEVQQIYTWYQLPPNPPLKSDPTCTA